MTRSELPGFYRLSLADRRRWIGDLAGLDATDLAILGGDAGLTDAAADRMVENAIGVMGLPLAVCANLRLDGADVLVPMAVEEASVVAAASHGAKLLRPAGGVTTTVSPAHMIGQIQLLDVADADAAATAILAHKSQLLARANARHPHLVAAGGGAIDLEVLVLPSGAPHDPDCPMVVVHLLVDVREAMGANTINDMCEELAVPIGSLARGRVGLRILSNLTDRRMVRARGAVPVATLDRQGIPGERLARRIEEASLFAERDPYRAATHNKGIMNGVDAVLVAFGQDWRAVSAGAHAFAARSGRYTALARWRVVGDRLEGELEMPLAVGVVGGVSRVHPTVQVCKKIAGVDTAGDLARRVAAVGLCQNLAALRALSAEGIGQGHMRLHARNLAVEAGAGPQEVALVAGRIADAGTVHFEAARAALGQLRHGSHAAPAPSVAERFEALREAHMPAVLALIERTIDQATPAGSTLTDMCRYHLETGGRRLRAMLPLLIAEGLGEPVEPLAPFAAACEMVHGATLVHDHIQGGDETRRGRETVWRRFGVSQAINCGDALFSYALLLVQSIDAPARTREALSRRVLREKLAVIDGQERELALRGASAPSLDDYFRMVEGKASGLFSLPIVGAAELLGAPGATLVALGEAARHLGVLFQIQDDVIDLHADQGRGARGRGVAEGKRSMLVVHALGAAPVEQREWLRAVLDKVRGETTEQEIEQAIELLDRTGSLDVALGEVERRAKLAADALGHHARLSRLIAGIAELLVEPIRPLLLARRGLHTDAPRGATDAALCAALLPDVSRTFALSISALPEGLREAVTAAYLMCRLVDTIEDDPKLAPGVRRRLFDRFEETLRADLCAPGPALDRLAAAATAAGLGATAAEHRLVAGAPAVFGLFAALPDERRAVIRPAVLRMSAGMRSYAERAIAEGGLRLRNLDDLEQYCYFVAGTVGELLTGLFETAAGELSPAARAAVRARAVPFGVGLQMVNIVKDVSADLARGACYLPVDLAREQGLEVEQILDPRRRPEALAVVRAVSARARLHLERAVEYTLAWPVPGGRAIRQFCAVPLALALASLAEVECGEDTLREGAVPKISREDVARLFRAVNDHIDDDLELAAIFGRAGLPVAFVEKRVSDGV